MCKIVVFAYYMAFTYRDRKITKVSVMKEVFSQKLYQIIQNANHKCYHSVPLHQEMWSADHNHYYLYHYHYYRISTHYVYG